MNNISSSGPSFKEEPYGMEHPSILDTYLVEKCDQFIADYKKAIENGKAPDDFFRERTEDLGSIIDTYMNLILSDDDDTDVEGALENLGTLLLEIELPIASFNEDPKLEDEVLKISEKLNSLIDPLIDEARNKDTSKFQRQQLKEKLAAFIRMACDFGFSALDGMSDSRLLDAVKLLIGKDTKTTKAALLILNRMLSTRPKLMADVKYQQGLALLHLKKFSEAIEAFNVALMNLSVGKDENTIAQRFEIYSQIAHAHNEAENFDEAFKQYNFIINSFEQLQMDEEFKTFTHDLKVKYFEACVFVINFVLFYPHGFQTNSESLFKFALDYYQKLTGLPEYLGNQKLMFISEFKADVYYPCVYESFKKTPETFQLDTDFMDEQPACCEGLMNFLIAHHSDDFWMLINFWEKDLPPDSPIADRIQYYKHLFKFSDALTNFADNKQMHILTKLKTQIKIFRDTARYPSVSRRKALSTELLTKMMNLEAFCLYFSDKTDESYQAFNMVGIFIPRIQNVNEFDRQLLTQMEYLTKNQKVWLANRTDNKLFFRTLTDIMVMGEKNNLQEKQLCLLLFTITKNLYPKEAAFFLEKTNQILNKRHEKTVKLVEKISELQLCLGDYEGAIELIDKTEEMLGHDRSLSVPLLSFMRLCTKLFVPNTPSKLIIEELHKAIERNTERLLDKDTVFILRDKWKNNFAGVALSVIKDITDFNRKEVFSRFLDLLDHESSDFQCRMTCMLFYFMLNRDPKNIETDAKEGESAINIDAALKLSLMKLINSNNLLNKSALVDEFRNYL